MKSAGNRDGLRTTLCCCWAPACSWPQQLNLVQNRGPRRSDALHQPISSFPPSPPLPFQEAQSLPCQARGAEHGAEQMLQEPDRGWWTLTHRECAGAAEEPSFERSHTVTLPSWAGITKCTMAMYFLMIKAAEPGTQSVGRWEWPLTPTTPSPSHMPEVRKFTAQFRLWRGWISLSPPTYRKRRPSQTSPFLPTNKISPTVKNSYHLLSIFSL